MKYSKYSLFIFLLAIGMNLKAQVGINNAGSPPDPSSILDVNSNSKGVLFPRMSALQRNSINSPAAGLIIFNTDLGKLQLFDGATWSSLSITDCIPLQPGIISGNNFPSCNQTGVVYTIPSLEGATNYHWTVPAGAAITNGQGTTGITVNFGTASGNVSVGGESGCGIGPRRDLAVSIGIPAQPGNITGDPFVECGKTGVVYSILPVSGAISYTWTVPVNATIGSGQGSNSITVNFGSNSGNVSVRAENSCGNSAYRTLAVSVNIPQAPAGISGNSYYLSGTSEIYFIAPIPSATSYQWTVPPDATILSGQGTTSIAVSFLTLAGNVSVRGVNSCGNGPYAVKAVQLFSCGNPYLDMRNNRNYNTVQVGSQCWFSQNLNVGTLVSLSSDQTNNGIIEKYCFGNSETNCDTYGGLYQWDEVMQYTTTQGTQGICPAGWHIPAQGEYANLVNFLGGNGQAGGKMKETGTAHWLSPNTGATNSSGFTGLPGGFRFHVDGTSIQLGQYGYFWSSTQNDGTHKWYRQLYNSDANAAENNTWKFNGFSIRCVYNDYSIGSGGACNNTVVNGTYTAGVNLTSAEYVTIQVTTSSIGPYTISTNTVNGYSFSRSGVFTTTGTHSVNLLATGTPIMAQTNNFIATISNSGSSCSFNVTVIPNLNAAYTIGTGNACNNATIAGTYNQGISLTANEYITIQANVTATGTYSVTTNAVNGYSFSGSGQFTSTGIKTINLYGSGTPVSVQTNNFTATANNGGGTCSFSVVVTVYIPIVTNPATGRIWMDRNLGASVVATSPTDAAAYGSYYQWGRFADGHQNPAASTTYTIATTPAPNAGNSWDGKFILEPYGIYPRDWVNPQNNTLWQGVNGTNNPCPSGFRIPTYAEWEAERASWSSNNATGAFNSPLKLTIGGYRHVANGTIYSAGSYGTYWSTGIYQEKASFMTIYTNNAYFINDVRAYGRSVRCIKE